MSTSAPCNNPRSRPVCNTILKPQHLPRTVGSSMQFPSGAFSGLPVEATNHAVRCLKLTSSDTNAGALLFVPVAVAASTRAMNASRSAMSAGSAPGHFNRASSPHTKKGLSKLDCSNTHGAKVWQIRQHGSERCSTHVWITLGGKAGQPGLLNLESATGHV